MKNLLRTSLRYHFRRPVYSLITFAGFTLSIAAALLIYLWVLNEQSYEKFHPGYERIYRVLTVAKQGNEMVTSSGNYAKVAEILETTYPQVENAVYISSYIDDLPLRREESSDVIESMLRQVSDDFFQVFQGFLFVEGSPETALDQPDKVVISEETARKLFGDKKALGETLVNTKYGSSAFTVSGVIQIPKQSHLQLDCVANGRGRPYSLPGSGRMIMSSIRNYGPGSQEVSLGPKEANVYIRLKENADIELLNSASDLPGKYNNSDKLLFQPLDDIHLHTDYVTNEREGVGEYKYVWIFSGLALLIILMASLNFSTLSVARASERANEIGVKKVNGANKALLFRQFMADSLLQTVLATLVALLLVQLSLPAFNRLIAQELEFNLSLRFMGNILLIISLVSTFSGIYPSLYLSSLPPVSIFRKGSATGSGTRFLKGLVTVQFTLAIFFIIATIVFAKQMNFISHKNLGMEDKNMVVIPTGLWYDNNAFKQELMQNPAILGVSASVSAPLDFEWNYSFSLSREGRTDTLETSLFWVDEDFAETYQLEVVKGRFLHKDYIDFNDEMTRKKLNGEQTVINETAERMLGFDDPIGKRVGNKLIVGVVKDFHFRPLHHPVGPLFMTHQMEASHVMNVHIAPGNIATTLSFIRDTYKKHREGRNFSYTFFEDMLSQKYLPDNRLRNICIAYSLLAIIIAVLGILAMSVFSIDCRTKEIALRRVSGATNSEILLLLNKAFIRWVVVAFVIACPIAWYAMTRWLENFAYKTELSWWIFALAGLLALGIALLTVSWQSWKAATRNPVESLRYE